MGYLIIGVLGIVIGVVLFGWLIAKASEWFIGSYFGW